MDETLRSFKGMQSGLIYIFDIITEVNGVSVNDLWKNENDNRSPQEVLDDALYGSVVVNLTIHRLEYALQTTAKIISVGMLCIY